MTNRPEDTDTPESTSPTPARRRRRRSTRSNHDGERPSDVAGGDQAAPADGQPTASLDATPGPDSDIGASAPRRRRRRGGSRSRASATQTAEPSEGPSAESTIEPSAGPAMPPAPQAITPPQAGGVDAAPERPRGQRDSTANNVQPAPAQPEGGPTQSDSAPTQAWGTLTQPWRTLAQPEGAPTQSDSAPTQPWGTLTQPWRTLAQPEGAPTRPEGVSTRSDGTPAQPAEPEQPAQQSRQRRRPASMESGAPTGSLAEPLTSDADTRAAEPDQAPKRPRRRRRGGGAGAGAETLNEAGAPTGSLAEPLTSDADTRAAEPDQAPKRPRRRRRGSGAGAGTETLIEPGAPTGSLAEPLTSDADTQAAEPDQAPKRPRRRRRGSGAGAGAEALIEPGAEATGDEEQRPRRRRLSGPTLGLDGSPVRGARTPDETADISFMHPSEREFAKLLDYYGIKYLYEPRSFPLRWEGNRVVEMHSPDFYLPEQDQYFELTTMKQSLVTQKNRKLREVRELYPEINIQLLYRRDYIRLLGKYGYGPMVDAKVEGLGPTLFTEAQLQQRVREIAAQITEDYAGQEPVLVGVLRSASIFLADLIRAIDLPTEMAFMSVSRYGGEHTGAVEVLRDVEVNVEGRPVILVEGIVDTGLTLRPIMQHLQEKRPASLDVCAMFDKRARRVIEVPLRYLGFEVPDEFIVGYGLDYNERYRNLRNIATLRVIEPKAVAQR